MTTVEIALVPPGLTHSVADVSELPVLLTAFHRSRMHSSTQVNQLRLLLP